MGHKDGGQLFREVAGDWSLPSAANACSNAPDSRLLVTRCSRQVDQFEYDWIPVSEASLPQHQAIQHPDPVMLVAVLALHCTRLPPLQSR